jgi:hypothetical protein
MANELDKTLENKVEKEGDRTNQPMTAQEVDPEQKRAHRAEIKERGSELTINPGDRINPDATLEEKATQVAVDAPDITGDHITVPTYFMVKEPDGEEKALHHVKDAEEISDVIRQARVDEDGNRTWW